jgi:glycosyltransferase involved in cell wall biosynthesis
MKVAVVTPTITSEKLKHCINSVQNQTYADVEHYIFIDGKEHFTYVESVIKKQSKKVPIKTIKLEENVGKGWYGHRSYAACSFLVNADVICYLDSDNWYDDNHVEKLVSKIDFGYDWAYSLRKICDKDGNYFCDDNCESLGKWPVYVNSDAYLIDTSAYAVKKEVAVKIGHAWYGQWGADRQFFAALKTYYPNFECTNAYTLNYRLDGNPNSVTEEFFKQGNEIYTKKYLGVFPWNKKDEIVLTF